MSCMLDFCSSQGHHTATPYHCEPKYTCRQSQKLKLAVLFCIFLCQYFSMKLFSKTMKWPSKSTIATYTNNTRKKKNQCQYSTIINFCIIFEYLVLCSVCFLSVHRVLSCVIVFILNLIILLSLTQLPMFPLYHFTLDCFNVSKLYLIFYNTLTLH